MLSNLCFSAFWFSQTVINNNTQDQALSKMIDAMETTYGHWSGPIHHTAAYLVDKIPDFHVDKVSDIFNTRKWNHALPNDFK